MDPLVQALIDQQANEGLGSNGFARKLGVDKATWSHVRRGLQAPSGAIYSAALRVYPEIVRRVAQQLEISNAADVRCLRPSEIAS